MPSKKIFAILIVCVGIIASVWLFEKSGGQISANESQKNTDLLSVTNQNSAGMGDWQKILVNIDQGTTTILTNKNINTTYPNEGTLTDQMAKDFMAQYLILKQNGGKITADQATKIAENTLLSAQTNKIGGIVYTTKDLNVNSQTNREIIENYKNNIKQTLETNSNQKTTEDELAILSRAIKSGKESDLHDLDIIISADKKIISGLINIKIPSDAVDVHLTFLNAASNVLTDTEAIRQTFSDPVKSFMAISQYKIHQANMTLAVKKLNDYFVSKINP